MPEPPSHTRRSFFGIGAGAALLCTIGGEEVSLDGRDAAPRADAAAARVRRPGALAQATFPAPQPAPGGTRREYWIQAHSVIWDIAPTGRDAWHDRRISDKTNFRAFAYQPMTPGFAQPLAGPSIPGPTLYAAVGDLLVVHFRNAERKLRQAVTMHPHGVRYTPDHDGVYLGDQTRPGGFIEPGETYTYLWEGDARLRRRVALPRPRPQPHAQHVPRAVRGDRHPRPRRQAAGPRVHVCSCTS